MRYSINLDCKTHHVNSDGKFPILLRVSLNGVHNYINTGRKIKESHYDKGKKAVKAGVAGSSALNSFIDRQKLKVEQIIEAFEKKGEVATIRKVKEIYKNETGKVKSKCFYEFVVNTIAEERSNSDATSGTLKNYESHLNKLKGYRKKLSIHDIDEKFLLDYKKYILTELVQAPNTAYNAMIFLRKHTRKLFIDGAISPDPFAKIVVGKPFLSDPDYLEPEELTSLHDLYDIKMLTEIVKRAKSKYAKDYYVGVKYQEVLRYFLVACYTGLRHSDIKSLRREHIKGGFIVKEIKKGRKGVHKIVRIPIRKRLFSLLDMDNPNGLIFENPVMESSQTNKLLLKIMAIAKINKHITFHVSRHSFSIISLLLGIKIEVISDILGHSELTTTQRYARVVDRLRDQEMDKWDSIVQEETSSSNSIEINCDECGSFMINFRKNTIRLNKVPCTCTVCNAQYLYNLKVDKLELANSMVVRTL